MQTGSPYHRQIGRWINFNDRPQGGKTVKLEESQDGRRGLPSSAAHTSSHPPQHGLAAEKDGSYWNPATWGSYNPNINEYPWTGPKTKQALRAIDSFRDLRRSNRSSRHHEKRDLAHPKYTGSRWWFNAEPSSTPADIEMATRRGSLTACESIEGSSTKTLLETSRPVHNDTSSSDSARSNHHRRQFSKYDTLRPSSRHKPTESHTFKYETVQSYPYSTRVVNDSASGMQSYEQAVCGFSGVQHHRAHRETKFASVERSPTQREAKGAQKSGRLLKRRQTAGLGLFSPPNVPLPTITRAPSSHTSDEDALAFWTSDTDLDLVNTTPTFILLHQLISQWDEVLLYMEASQYGSLPPPCLSASI